MELNDFIKVFSIDKDDVYKNLCDDAIAFHKSNYLKRSYPGSVARDGKNVLDKKIKIVNQILLNPSDNIYEPVYDFAKKYIELYSNSVPLFPWGKVLLDEFTIKLYPKKEGIHKYHIDTDRGFTFTRLFACIWYLNTIKVGGFTSFPDLDTLIPAKKNTLLTFPCNFLFPHQGDRPISEDRYVMTYFVYAANEKGEYLLKRN